MRFDTQNKDMQNNDNQFIGFSIKLFSQNTGNGISDHQDFKFFGGKTPRSSSGTPNQCSHDSLCLKNIPVLHTQKVGQSVEVLPMKVMHTPT